MLNIFQYRLGLQIIPVSSSSIDEQGEMEVLSSDGKLYFHNGSSKSPVVTEIHASQGTNRLKNKDLEDSTTAIVDDSDTTKKILFNAAGTTGTSTTLTSSQTANRIIILPDASGTLVIATGSIVSNVKLDDSTVFFVDTSDSTKEFHIDASGTTGTSTTLLATQTANRVLTLPDLTDNLVSRTSTDTLTNKSLALTSNTISSTASRAAEFNGSGNLSPSTITTTELGYLSGVTSNVQTQLNTKGDVFTTAVQTLTNKSLEDSTTFIIDNLDNTKKAQFQASGISTGTTRTYTLPDITDTLITRTSTDTGSNRLKNKDLEDTTTNIVKSSNTTSKLIFDLSLQNNGITTTIQPLSSSGRLIQLPNSDALLVGTDVQQTLTNKDIDGGTASNTNRITIPKDIKTNLNSLTRKEATILYASDEDKFYGDDGVALFPIGSGSGSGINYIDNPDADSGTTGYATYADAAGSEPIDGTGGVAGITFTVNTTTPLRGPNDFQLSKGASNLQGNGVSYDFTIDNQDKNQKLKIEFDYAGTANFVAGSSSDVRVFIYDITNNTLIRPDRTTLTTGAGTYISSFYASSSTSYRLIFHVATTSALAYDLHLDRISVGPSENSLLVGPSIGDFTDYIPTIQGAGIPTNVSFQYRRVGDSLEIHGFFTAGTSTATEAQISLPDGLTIDSNKVSTNGDVVGVTAGDNGLNGTITVIANGGNSFLQFGASNSLLVSAITPLNGNDIWSSTSDQSLFAKVPITNWTANIAIAPSGVIRISEILANGTRVTGTPPTELGQYRSYLRNASANTYTETNGDPTTPPSAADGIKIYGSTTWAAGDSSNQPSRYDIFVGKFKSLRFEAYTSTGRTSSDAFNTDVYIVDGLGLVSGLVQEPDSYDPTTGILTVYQYANAAGTSNMYLGQDISGNLLNELYFDVLVADNDYQIQLYSSPIFTTSSTLSGTTTSGTPTLVTNGSVNVTRQAGELFEIFLQSDGGIGSIHVNSVSTAYPRGIIQLRRNTVVIAEEEYGVANSGTTAQADWPSSSFRFIDENPVSGLNTYELYFYVSTPADTMSINNCVMKIKKVQS